MISAAVAVPLWFAFLLLMNGYHLGANAALHWDAVDGMLTASPMPTKAQLAVARQHVFDLAREAGSDDPDVVTRYFMLPANLGRHGPLETVRRYYSQVSFALARTAFQAGGRLSGSPTGGVVAVQLSAAAAMAVGLGLLTALALATSRDRGQRAMAALAFVAVGSTPTFLSLSRQMLTETAAWLFLIPGLLLAAGRSRRSAAAAGATLFLAIRSRYNFAPAIALLLPLVWVLVRRGGATRPQPCRSPTDAPGPGSSASVPALRYTSGVAPESLRALIGIATFAACVAVDLALYGPLFMPSAYAEALVRSTRLYFHTTPPYDQFLTALFVNGPLMLLPILGVAAGLIGAGPWRRRATAARVDLATDVTHGRLRPTWYRPVLLYAAAVLAVAAVPIMLMARQQVSYQPRHLFALSGLYAVVLLLVVPTIRWRRWTAAPFAIACGLSIAANVYSTVGPQRTTMRLPWPPTVMQSIRHRWTTPGLHESWAAVLLNGYFDWSDNRRLYDPLVALRYVRRLPGRPLLVVSGGVEGSGCYCSWATQYGPAVIWWPPTGVGDAAAVAAALRDGRPVVAVLPPGGTLPGFHVVPTGVGVDRADLYTVTAADHAP
jgi:hypothetical protein